MAEKVSILVDVEVAGAQDTAALQNHINQLGKASQSSSVQVAALAARTNELNAKSRELGKAVSSGTKSIKEAEREFSDFKKTLKEIPTDGIEKVDKSSSRLGSTLSSLAAGGALAAIGGGLLAFGKNAIETASDVEEMQSKFNTVFKDLSGSVTEDLQTFADAANRSIFDLQGFAATLQDTFVPLGFARDEAASLSVELVKLAEDLASFNNLETADVVTDLQSALVGNTETLRKYGVVASQATIEQEALESGLISHKSELDATTKAQAIYQLAIKGTADAQGDAIATSDSFANQVKGLQAAFSELAAAIGAELLPAAGQVVTVLTDITKVATENIGAMSQVSDQVGRIGDEFASNEGGVAGFQKRLEDVAIVANEVGKSFGIVTPQLDKYATNASQARKETAAMTAVVDESTGAWGENNSLVETAAQLAEKEAAALEELNRVQGIQDQQQGRLIDLYASATAAQNDARDGIQEYGDTSERVTELAAERIAKEQELAETERLLAEQTAVLASQSGDLFAEYAAGEGPLKFFNESLEEVGEQMVIVGGRTAEQNADLGRLQDAYNKAANTLSDYELGIKGANLTDEERNKKMAEQQAIMASLSANMEPLIAVTGEYASVTGELTVNQAAVNSAMLSAADAGGANAEQMALLAVATGQMSEAQATALIQQVALEQSLAALGEQYADGTLSLDEYVSAANKAVVEVQSLTIEQNAQGEASKRGVEALELLGNSYSDQAEKAGLLAGSTETAGSALDSAAGKARDLSSALAEIPNTKEIAINIATSGSLPSGVSASEVSVRTGGSVGFAAGTSGIMKVPSGFPNDSFPVNLQSGEEFAVAPAGQSLQSMINGSSGGVTNSMSITVHVGAGADAAEVEDGILSAAASLGFKG